MERALFSLFFPCLIGCVSMVLFQVWTQGSVHSPLYFQIAATLFIVGLASFLTWFIHILSRILRQSA